MNQGSNDGSKPSVDYNRVYSEEGINAIFRMFGAENISDAMVPTSQTFKCWVNGQQVRQFVVKSDNHFQFYEVIVNRIVDEKMGYEEAREFVKSVKKGLRQIQGTWSKNFGGVRGQLIRQMSMINRPLTVHRIVDDQQRVPFELVMYWVFEKKIGENHSEDCKYDCCKDKELMRLVKDKDREYEEEIRC